MYLQRITCWGLAVVVCLLGAACNKVAEKASEAAAEQAIEAASGGQVDVDYSGDTMKVTDKETGVTTEVTGDGESGSWTMTDPETGETTEVKAETGTMPEGWPASLPQYPGSTIEMSQVMDSPDGRMLMVSLKCADATDMVTAFYADKAAAAGFKEMGNFSTPEGGQTMYESDTQALTVHYSPDEGGTDVTLQLIDKS